MVTGAPYYVINYDDVSGKTDTITSGNATSLRTIILFREQIENILNIDPRLKKVLEAVRELEHLLGYSKLDIEFAVDNNNQCFTFQIRPITINHLQYKIDEKKFYFYLQKARQQFNTLQKKPKHIYGNFNVFSRMTDWNPAEIGTRPNTLAINLYDHLITKKSGQNNGQNMGIAILVLHPYYVIFCSQPFVDCRASINSFIPANLSKGCAMRLVDAYLKLLKEKPHLHDKLELDIVFTVWVPTFKEDAKDRFKNLNVSSADIMELEKALKTLTVDAINRLDKDTSSISILSDRFEKLSNSDFNTIDKIYHLIEDCRKFGTLAFAHAARAGFVAVTILKVL